jgi:hypothetical protein
MHGGVRSLAIFSVGSTRTRYNKNIEARSESRARVSGPGAWANILDKERQRLKQIEEYDRNAIQQLREEHESTRSRTERARGLEANAMYVTPGQQPTA